MVLTSDEQKSLTGSVKEYSRVSGLIILSYKRDMMLYDNILKQSLLLPPEIDLVHAARGEIEGTYFLWDGSGVFLWDRYGREPTKKTTSLEYQGYTFSWEKGQLRSLIKQEHKQFLDYGFLFFPEKSYLSRMEMKSESFSRENNCQSPREHLPCL